jgi:hypothetical protein
VTISKPENKLPEEGYWRIFRSSVRYLIKTSRAFIFNFSKKVAKNSKNHKLSKLIFEKRNYVV